MIINYIIQLYWYLLNFLCLLLYSTPCMAEMVILNKHVVVAVIKICAIKLVFNCWHY